MEEASLIEPLSVGIHACRKANIGMGQKVLVLGAGPVGLVSMMVAKATNATKAFVTDVVDHRLAIGRELGADECINVKGINPNEAAQMIIDKFGSAPDIAIECSGVQSSIELAIKVRE
ncbi:unnamed protein product [Gongylonema pulchrum]|uniref:ADH_zinc_N domain-containing protein n=1 Tax=Gongylonema pulchrum TaxID=637853 RepID=A0A183DMQ3_9BILA|nr:unnamed protein product [Gongylonema pulchrum]